MDWRPTRTLGLIAGALIGTTLVSITWMLARTAQRMPLGLSLLAVGVLGMGMLVLLAWWGYRYAQLASLCYRLDRNGLVIRCVGHRRVVPMAVIQAIVAGDQVRLRRDRIETAWPGYYRGQVDLYDRPTCWVHSTVPLDRQLVVITNAGCYGISPASPTRFLADYEARRALGPIHLWEPSEEPTGLAAWPIWRDRLFWPLALLTLLANLGLAAIVVGHYGAGSAHTSLPLGARRAVAEPSARDWLLVIPAIGALAWVTNTALGALLYRHEKALAYMLDGASLGIQALLWLAVWQILPAW
ncbi:MAG: PH domain-containing protein [Chloroflexota bacterium]